MEKTGIQNGAPRKLTIEEVFAQLKRDGGHVFFGEYRGVAAQFRDAFDKNGNRQEGGKRYLSLTHSIEIIHRGLPVTQAFKERVPAHIGSEAEALASCPAKKGDKVVLFDPVLYAVEKGVTSLSVQTGKLVVLA